MISKAPFLAVPQQDSNALTFARLTKAFASQVEASGSYVEAASSDVGGEPDQSLQPFFKDIDNIPIAEDFQRAIGRALRNCDVMIAIIGPGWLGIDSDGARRIDRDRDWIRREIEMALALDIPIIPVLVERGHMPSPQQVPEGMRDITRLNALIIEAGPDYEKSGRPLDCVNR